MPMRASGFTLVELIIVIVLIGILAAVVGPIISKPFEQYNDVAARAQLVDQADTALRFIKREVETAIPNSIRVSTSGSRSVMEMMPVLAAGRYRLGEADDDSALFPSGEDDAFDVLSDAFTLPANARMVVNNTDANRLYAAAVSGSDGIITPAGTTVAMTYPRITFSDPFQFDLVGIGSPRKRFYITQTPVTYHCDTDSGNLIRYRGYTPSATQPTLRTNPPLSTAASDLLVENVTACRFLYSAGTPERLGLLTLELTLTGENAESVRLMHQVHVRNVP